MKFVHISLGFLHCIFNSQNRYKARVQSVINCGHIIQNYGYVFQERYFLPKFAESLSLKNFGLHSIHDTYIYTYVHNFTCVQTYSQSTFPSMYASLDLGNAGVWAQFASSSQCEREFPPSLMKKISPFQQVNNFHSHNYVYIQNYFNCNKTWICVLM